MKFTSEQEDAFNLVGAIVDDDQIEPDTDLDTIVKDLDKGGVEDYVEKVTYLRDCLNTLEWALDQYQTCERDDKNDASRELIESFNEVMVAYEEVKGA